MRVGIILASAALFLGACGSGTDVGSDEAEEFNSPIADFLGFDTSPNFDAAEEQEKYQEQEREAQQRIAECMRAEGFEYTPVDYSEINSFEEAALNEPEWGSDEWVETYGFGISTQRFSQAQVGPDLIGYDDSFTQEYEDFEDPNQDYVESLGPEEQNAYYEVLYGAETGPDIDFENMTEDEINQAYDDYYQNEYVATGCQNVAYEEIYEEGGIFGEDSEFMRFQNEFGDELEELFNRVESDPRLVEAREKISTCVSDKGYPEYIDEQSVYEDIDNRMNDLDSFGNFRDPFMDFTEEEMEAMSEEDFDRIFEEVNTETLSDSDLALLGEIQTYELGLAAAVNECGGGFFGTTSELNEIRAEIEQEWLDANRDRIAEFEGVASTDS